MKRKIVITGATGLIGQEICKLLNDRGDKITVLTRDINKGKMILPYLTEFIEWDYNKPEVWNHELEDKDVIINLAGANIFGKRWSNKYKDIILESRKLSTKNLVDSIGRLNNKPKLFLCASAVGYYGNKEDEILIEESPSGSDFLSDVCREWEKEASQVENFNVRRVSIRNGIVLSKKEGALKKMLLPFKLFIGGSLGSGKQWFPWIHIDDIVNIYLFAIDSEITGAVNGTSPNPVTMKDFTKTLGKVIHRPSFISIPELALRLAVGDGAESILSSLRVLPDKLIQSGFKFRYERLEEALRSLLIN